MVEGGCPTSCKKVGDYPGGGMSGRTCSGECVQEKCPEPLEIEVISY